MSTVDCYNRGRGFTLIELLVVLLLVGLTLGVTLRFGFGTEPQSLENEIRALATATELMVQEAVLENRVIGLDFFTAADGPQTGYRWLQYDGERWGETESGSIVHLQAAESADLEVEGIVFDAEPLADLSLAEIAATFVPEVILQPTREMTPFVLVLSNGDNHSKLSADLLGRLYVNEDLPHPPR